MAVLSKQWTHDLYDLASNLYIFLMSSLLRVTCTSDLLLLQYDLRTHHGQRKHPVRIPARWKIHEIVAAAV